MNKIKRFGGDYYFFVPICYKHEYINICQESSSYSTIGVFCDFDYNDSLKESLQN